tara:strand:+ start:13229 stop:13600 length:372 start_codon:yes stop_codon:yes gene_type:complete
MQSTNVFGDSITPCSNQPLTGFFRDGCCNTDDSDTGVHTVCIVAAEEFLTFSKLAGNDLSTPMPQYHFAGVKAGDKWCLCAARFLQAHQNNAAPLVYLEATNEKTLEIVPMSVLLKYAYYGDK